MRILLMDRLKYPLNSASDIHRHELIKSLALQGNQIIAFGNHPIDGTNILIIYPTKFAIAHPFFLRVEYIVKLFLLAYTANIEVIYTRNEIIGIIGYILKLLTSCKLIIEVNGIISDEWESFEKQNLNTKVQTIKQNILIKIHMFATKRADVVIAITDGIKNYMVKKGMEELKIFVVNNGVNTTHFRPISDIGVLSAFKEKLGIENTFKIVLFVGSLAPWQGVDYLIMSAPSILKSSPNVKFLIVGDGVMRKKLESMVDEYSLRSNFIFTGKTSYDEIPIYINIADVCIVTKKPLISGYSPLKLFEYMSCGKPVVATRTDGFEIIENYNCGILINHENIDELSNAVIKIISNETIEKNMGLNARTAVVSNFSWEIAAKKISQICANS